MILVTGATGDVGGEVLRQVVAAGAAARALARDPAKATKLPPGVEVARGDLLQPDTLAAAFAGATKLFLMAHAQDLPRVAEHVVPIAKAAGVRHVVLLSSGTTLADPPVAIGRWHLAAEHELEASGMSWTMLRPGNFASNALRWAATIKAQGTVYAPGDGTGKSAPIDPFDIASVGATALTGEGHEGKKYLLTGEEVITAAEQIEIIARAIGKPVRLVPVPATGAKAGMMKSGMNEELADAVLELMTGRVSDRLVSEDVRRVTGRAPRTFAEWAKNNVAAFL
jgi:uncharacterized protein YbjT (DUF2867 family)